MKTILNNISYEELNALTDEQKKSGNFSENTLNGIVSGCDVRTCKGESGEFKMIDLIVKGEKNKVYKKSFSADFARKFFGQLGYKVRETIGAHVFFTEKKPYKNIARIGFWVANDEGVVEPWVYTDQNDDVDKMLDELGL